MPYLKKAKETSFPATTTLKWEDMFKNALHWRLARIIIHVSIKIYVDFMRVKVAIFIVLLYLVGTVAAVGIPDTILVTSSKNWTVANKIDQSTITITVTNTTPGYNGPVEGKTLDLYVDPLLGTISPIKVTTNQYGIASGTYTVTTKSGEAQITATIPGEGLSGSTIQHIDHDSPYIAYFSYPLQGEVNAEIPFTISFTDRWGNPVDSRKEVASGPPLHSVTLHMNGPPPNDCGFSTSSGYIHNTSATLNPDGSVSVIVKLTSRTGNNYINMEQFGSIPEKIAWIVVESTGVPSAITGTISDGGILPVDTSPFIIDYFLYDIYGNPVRNRSIWVNTTPINEQKIFTTNALGRIRLYYGPMMTASDITFTATSVDNSTVINQLDAHFVYSGPTNMVLTITPQTMASRDVSTSEQVFVRATVIDNFGNPVPHEPVSFSLGTVSAEGFTQTAQPSLSSTTALTDNDGNAIVLFYPGSFATWSEPGYNRAATGQVVIRATWNDLSRSVTATWKNYPYLSIIPSADKQNVKLNDTVDITIDVIGDGYNLQGGNVAAILDLDSSSSIWSNPDTPGPRRIDSAKVAAKAFAIEMLGDTDVSTTTNWIGVNSYGNEKKDDDRLLAPQNVYLPLVESKINNLVRGTNSQQFGASIRDAINNLTNTQNSRTPDKVRAVIALKDSGGGNLEANGLPQAESDAAAVIALANSTSPRTMIFTVYYYDGKSESSSTQLILQNIANNTGGKFFRSENSEQLKLDFIEIANILKTAAGVNASLTLDVRKIEQEGNQINSSEVFSYVPVGPFYDLDPAIVSRDAVQGRTRIFWPNSTHSVINQSDEWNTTHKLHFDIGTINISERWNATYRLKAVNKTGLMNLFNCTLSGSRLSYNDNEENVCLPDLYVMVTQNDTPKLPQTGLAVWNLAVTKSGPIRDYLPLEWNIRYTGYETATEKIQYQYNNGPFIPMYTRTNIANGNYTHIAQLDIQKLPPGMYRIYVNASALDALEASDGPVDVNIDRAGIYILLQ